MEGEGGFITLKHATSKPFTLFTYPSFKVVRRILDFPPHAEKIQHSLFFHHK